MTLVVFTSAIERWPNDHPFCLEKSGKCFQMAQCKRQDSENEEKFFKQTDLSEEMNMKSRCTFLEVGVFGH